MRVIKRFTAWIGRRLDAVEERVERPAKDAGTYLQGSEVMIEEEPRMAKEHGRAVRNKRSGFGRGI